MPNIKEAVNTTVELEDLMLFCTASPTNRYRQKLVFKFKIKETWCFSTKQKSLTFLGGVGGWVGGGYLFYRLNKIYFYTKLLFFFFFLDSTDRKFVI